LVRVSLSAEPVSLASGFLLGAAFHPPSRKCVGPETEETPVAGETPGLPERAMPLGEGKMIALSISTVRAGPRFLAGMRCR
jgi:hypothetical protein